MTPDQTKRLDEMRAEHADRGGPPYGYWSGEVAFLLSIIDAQAAELERLEELKDDYARDAQRRDHD